MATAKTTWFLPHAIALAQGRNFSENREGLRGPKSGVKNPLLVRHKGLRRWRHDPHAGPLMDRAGFGPRKPVFRSGANPKPRSI